MIGPGGTPELLLILVQIHWHCQRHGLGFTGKPGIGNVRTCQLQFYSSGTGAQAGLPKRLSAPVLLEVPV